ncbi:MAG: hypothetical protein FWB99_08790 [Treponema sp.]|nr:hypothetical protein [Treponema sp.]
MPDAANEQTSSHPVLTGILVVAGIIILTAGVLGVVAVGLRGLRGVYGIDDVYLGVALLVIPGAVMLLSPFVLGKDISYKVFYCAPAAVGLFTAILALAHAWRLFIPGDYGAVISSFLIVFGGLLLIIASLAVIFQVNYKKVILCACILLIAHAALQVWYVFHEFIRFNRGIETPQGLILAGNALFIIAFFIFSRVKAERKFLIILPGVFAVYLALIGVLGLYLRSQRFFRPSLLEWPVSIVLFIVGGVFLLLMLLVLIGKLPDTIALYIPALCGLAALIGGFYLTASSLFHRWHFDIFFLLFLLAGLLLLAVGAALLMATYRLVAKLI